jgi:organic radical activating enzyme
MLDINDRITKLPVFPSLGWVWTFDIIKDIFDNNQPSDESISYVDEVIADGVTLQQIFNKFFEDVETLDINMDQGGEMLEETIRDWMNENAFLVPLDEDGWLE